MNANILSLFFLVGYVGFINFLKSCTLPFTVGFFIFFLSLLFWHISHKKQKKFWSTFKYALLFSLGFIIIFVAKSATLTAVGQNLSLQATFYTRLGGLIIAFIGLAMLPTAWAEKLRLTKWAGLSAIVGGGVFALSWQPCSKFVIPLFQSFLTKPETQAIGYIFVTLVSVGIVAALLILSIPISLLMKYLRLSDGVLKILQTIGAAILIILGLLFLTGQMAIFYSLVGSVQDIFINK